MTVIFLHLILYMFYYILSRWCFVNGLMVDLVVLYMTNKLFALKVFDENPK